MKRKLFSLLSYILTLLGTVLLVLSFWKTGQPWAPGIICWLVGVVLLIARPSDTAKEDPSGDQIIV